ncbi:MAG: glutaminyl-peptide cyclotransferase [Nevskia sp.]|nr:glutaminyl-peptide cyclotransferase [Nevskia sp.]
MLLCCMGLAGQTALAAPTLNYRVVRTEAHDATAFTQGLAIADGQLIEGTGLYGQSHLTVRDLASGKLLYSTSLTTGEFGEGVTVVGDRIIQLTWMNAVAYVYDRTLKQIGSFPLSTEGWGLAYDGQRLILSDGSSRLRFLDPVTYTENSHVDVTDQGRQVEQLNELEFVDGLIYANVWQSDRIAIIDPESGVIRAWLDLAALKGRLSHGSGWSEQDFVLNGIATIPKNGHLLVTGKCWPLMFELAVDNRSLRRHKR